MIRVDISKEKQFTVVRLSTDGEFFVFTDEWAMVKSATRVYNKPYFIGTLKLVSTIDQWVSLHQTDDPKLDIQEVF